MGRATSETRDRGAPGTKIWNNRVDIMWVEGRKEIYGMI